MTDKKKVDNETQDEDSYVSPPEDKKVDEKVADSVDAPGEYPDTDDTDTESPYMGDSTGGGETEESKNIQFSTKASKLNLPEDELKDKVALGLGAISQRGGAYGYKDNPEALLTRLKTSNAAINEYKTMINNIKEMALPTPPDMTNAGRRASASMPGATQGLMAPTPPVDPGIDTTIQQLTTVALQNIASIFGALAPASSSNAQAPASVAAATGAAIIASLHKQHDANMIQLYKIYGDELKNYNTDYKDIFDKLVDSANKDQKYILDLFKTQAGFVNTINTERATTRNSLISAIGKEEAGKTSLRTTQAVEKNKAKKSWSDASRTNAMTKLGATNALLKLSSQHNSDSGQLLALSQSYATKYGTNLSDTVNNFRLQKKLKVWNDLNPGLRLQSDVYFKRVSAAMGGETSKYPNIIRLLSDGVLIPRDFLNEDALAALESSDLGEINYSDRKLFVHSRPLLSFAQHVNLNTGDINARIKNLKGALAQIHWFARARKQGNLTKDQARIYNILSKKVYGVAVGADVNSNIINNYLVAQQAGSSLFFNGTPLSK